MLGVDHEPLPRLGATWMKPRVGSAEPQADTSADNERALIERCCAGDERAIRLLYEAHVESVNRKLAAMLGPDPELDDLVQMTFVRAFQNLPRFRGDARLSTWLHRIALNLAYSHLASARRRRWLRTLDFTKLSVPSPIAPIDQAVEHAEWIEALYSALNRVKPKNRLAFVLTQIEGHTLDEAAELLGISRNTIAARVRRTRAYVRRALLRREQRNAPPEAPATSKEGPV